MTPSSFYVRVKRATLLDEYHRIRDERDRAMRLAPSPVIAVRIGRFYSLALSALDRELAVLST